MPRTKLPQGSVPVTFRLPRQIHKLLAAKARRAELSLAELIRRALRREVEAAERRTRNER
jgi:predicted HicB family RNase H-like nuclease